MKHHIIVITGPTATGKSDLALKLAESVGGEIINADIGSFYTPLTIGTAKPDWRKEKVPHHLFDILDTPKKYTVVQFRNRVAQLAQEILARGNTPIVVGGSAFYIKSLWYRQVDSPCAQKEVQQIDDSDVSTLELWNRLSIIDSARATKIYQQDRYRIVRALALHQVTGCLPSSFEQIYDPIAPMKVIFCWRDREDLYQRINMRTQIMLKQGWIEEVQKLMGSEWEEFLVHKKIIGYDDVVHYLHDNISYDNLVLTVQQKTRNYAKRQITFLKKLKSDITLSSTGVNLEHGVCEVNLSVDRGDVSSVITLIS